jgi:hypothetical protein
MQTMLDKLKDLFKEGLGYTHVAGLLQQLANINNIQRSIPYAKSSRAARILLSWKR